MKSDGHFEGTKRIVGSNLWALLYLSKVFDPFLKFLIPCIRILSHTGLDENFIFLCPVSKSFAKGRLVDDFFVMKSIHTKVVRAADFVGTGTILVVDLVVFEVVGVNVLWMKEDVDFSGQVHFLLFPLIADLVTSPTWDLNSLVLKLLIKVGSVLIDNLSFGVNSYAGLLPKLLDFLFFFEHVFCVGDINNFIAELFEPIFCSSFRNVDPSQPRTYRLGYFFKLAVGVDVPVLVPPPFVPFLHLVYD